jgi:hypothetical protein
MAKRRAAKSKKRSVHHHIRKSYDLITGKGNELVLVAGAVVFVILSIFLFFSR